MKMEQAWLDFLREQYPRGSRIRLTEKSNDPSHSWSGTLGTLECIDELGAFRVQWDNGEILNVVIGEDQFTVFPPKPKLLLLYMPMALHYYGTDEDGYVIGEEQRLPEQEAIRHVDLVAAALREEDRPYESERGLMFYYDHDDSIERKVRTLQFTAEVRDGKLWGVAECMVAGHLDQEELSLLKTYVEAQALDGFGAAFEEHPIEADGQKLYCHLWQRENWEVLTEQERFAPKFEADPPEMCFSTLPSTGQLICIKRGKPGYALSEWGTSDSGWNAEIADELNERLGVTPAQRQAMEIGSMVGWDAPGADPAAWENKTESQQMGGVTLDRENLRGGDQQWQFRGL